MGVEKKEIVSFTCPCLCKTWKTYSSSETSTRQLNGSVNEGYGLVFKDDKRSYDLLCFRFFWIRSAEE